MAGGTPGRDLDLIEATSKSFIKGKKIGVERHAADKLISFFFSSAGARTGVVGQEQLLDLDK